MNPSPGGTDVGSNRGLATNFIYSIQFKDLRQNLWSGDHLFRLTSFIRSRVCHGGQALLIHLCLTYRVKLAYAKEGPD